MLPSLNALFDASIQCKKTLILVAIVVTLGGVFHDSIASGMSNHIQNYFDALQSMVDQQYFAC